MSTSKHIDKICIATTAVTLIVTVLFMFGESLGLTVMTKAMPYVSTFFDTSYVHTIDIVMDNWDDFIENCESEEYSPCTAVIDGEKYSNIAIRGKGNTSLSTVSTLGSDRYSFKIEFDHYNSTCTLDGLDKLCLNNLIQDATMMKDYIAYTLMNKFGVDSPLCSFVYMTVNGEDWGLYLAVEGIEDSFLERNYGSGNGDLYKPDSISAGGGRGNGKGFNMDDFDFGDFDIGSIDTSDIGAFNPDESGNSNPTGGNTGNENSENTGNQGGFTPPGGFNPNGNGGNAGNQGGFNPNGGGDSTGNGGGMTPPGGFNPTGDNTSGGNVPSFNPGDNTGGGAGGNNAGMSFGMGSDDVKLKYIDDDIDSYSNIFDNAKTNTTKADKKRLINSLKNLSEYKNLEQTVDIDEVIRYFVVHNFVCNGDSYTGSMIHNYYLYEEDGVMSMIPWDYNLAYGTFQGTNASDTVNTSIDSPISGGTVDDRPMLGWIFSDDEYTSIYHSLFGEFIEQWFTNGELVSLIENTYEMIKPYVDKDPTKFYTSEEFDAGVEALKTFVTLRAEAVSNQLNGDSTKVETGDLNLSDMGTMNNGAGNMDMPDAKDKPEGRSEIPGEGSDTGSQDSDVTVPSQTEEIPAETSASSGTANAAASFLSAGQNQMADGNINPQGGNQPDVSGGPGGNMPADISGGSGGNTPPDMSGSPAESMVMPDGSGGEVSGGNTPPDMSGGPGGNMGMPDDSGQNNNPFDINGKTINQTGSGEASQWILVFVSVVVLGAGLFIVIKKKI